MMIEKLDTHMKIIDSSKGTMGTVPVSPVVETLQFHSGPGQGAKIPCAVPWPKQEPLQLNVRAKTVKILEEKVENLYDLELGRVLKYNTMKEKKKTELQSVENVCTSKDAI